VFGRRNLVLLKIPSTHRQNFVAVGHGCRGVRLCLSGVTLSRVPGLAQLGSQKDRNAKAGKMTARIAHVSNRFVSSCPPGTKNAALILGSAGTSGEIT
jgi:hypothetical protein